MSYEYDRYLEQHRTMVFRGFSFLFKYLSEFTDFDNAACKLFAHDASKYLPEEYKAYDAYFYSGNRSDKVVRNFQKAWLRHIHQNPHHWQYWVLINDDPNEGEIVLEMPLNYVVEMICDWWSFSLARDKPYEIFEWYEAHKNYMKLHPKTRKKVEDILAGIKKELDVQHEIDI